MSEVQKMFVFGVFYLLFNYLYLTEIASWFDGLKSRNFKILTENWKSKSNLISFILPAIFLLIAYYVSWLGAIFLVLYFIVRKLLDKFLLGQKKPKFKESLPFLVLYIGFSAVLFWIINSQTDKWVFSLFLSLFFVKYAIFPLLIYTSTLPRVFAKNIKQAQVSKKFKTIGAEKRYLVLGKDSLENFESLGNKVLGDANFVRADNLGEFTKKAEGESNKLFWLFGNFERFAIENTLSGLSFDSIIVLGDLDREDSRTLIEALSTVGQSGRIIVSYTPQVKDFIEEAYLKDLNLDLIASDNKKIQNRIASWNESGESFTLKILDQEEDFIFPKEQRESLDEFLTLILLSKFENFELKKL